MTSAAFILCALTGALIGWLLARDWYSGITRSDLMRQGWDFSRMEEELHRAQTEIKRLRAKVQWLKNLPRLNQKVEFDGEGKFKVIEED